MNRYRINEILEILLFPFTDSRLREKDYLYEKCRVYKKYLDISAKDNSYREAHIRISDEFRSADKNLAHYLSKRTGVRIKSYDEVKQLCELYYPYAEIEKKIEHVRLSLHDCPDAYSGKEIINLYYLKNLVRIADSLITYRDGKAAIRTWSNSNVITGKKDIFESEFVFDKVEIWNILCRFIVPDILIVIFAVESNLTEAALYAQKPNISLTDKLLDKCLKKGLAENHLHFNAGFNYEALWIYTMNIYLWLESKEEGTPDRESVQCFQAAVFRMLVSEYLSGNAENLACGFRLWLSKKDKAFGGIMEDMYAGKETQDIASCIKTVFRILLKKAEMDIPEKGGAEDYLSQLRFRNYSELKITSEWLVLYKSYEYIKKNFEDLYFAVIFMQYLRIKNEYFRESQQRYVMQGLNYFQEIFGKTKGNMKRAAGSNGVLLEGFRAQAKVTSLRKLEIRIAPDAQKAEIDYFRPDVCYPMLRESLLKQLYNIFYTYRQYILEEIAGVRVSEGILSEEKEKIISGNRSFCDTYKILSANKEIEARANTLQAPTIGIVYHFIKSRFLDNESGYFCWRNIHEDMTKYSEYKLVWREYMLRVAMTIERIRSSIPLMSEYIVGIDAASDENAMEPWFFSPIYNQMRSREAAIPVFEAEDNNGNKKYYNIQNISFTYHVGEDFRHVLSGLRHIDEVIERFGYKAGDRLGHAIALGIDIEEWAADNESVPIPRQEHMENLLWIWGKNVEGDMFIPVQLERLEEKILNLAEKIYTRLENITVRMLYEAYKQKFSYAHKEKLEKMNREFPFCFSPQIEKDKRVLCFYGESGDKAGDTSWNAEKLFCTNYCPVYEEKYNEVELLQIEKSEIEAYKAIQEALLKKVERMGIYVEANPTSNVTIGDIDRMEKHPIFRMNSLEGGGEDNHHIMVTINSDDPAVFNTNVENEMAYIYYALEHSGYSKEDILKWIDKIRQFGLDASFIQKEKKVWESLKEISEILDAIKKEVKI